MSHGFVLNIKSHKFLVLAGAALVAATLFWAEGRLQSFENDLTLVMEASLVTSSELRSMEQRALYLEMAAESAMTEARQNAPELLDETALVDSSYELGKLREEAGIIKTQNQEVSKRYHELLDQKKRLMRRFQLSYWGSLLGLMGGAFMVTAGLVFWYFRIKLIKDRRDAPRADEAEG